MNFDALTQWYDGIAGSTPPWLLAIALFIGAWIIGSLIKFIIITVFKLFKREVTGRFWGGLIKFSAIVAGAVAAFKTLYPTVTLADIGTKISGLFATTGGNIKAAHNEVAQPNEATQTNVSERSYASLTSSQSNSNQINSSQSLESDTPMQSNTDTPGEIDLNPTMLVEKIDSWLDGLVRLAPNLVVALVVIILFWLVGSVAKSLVLRTFRSRGRDNLGEVLGGFLKMAIVIFGIIIGATIVLPNLSPADIVAGLGVSSVAIGFAFKDILQNWLAGLLILLRQPFEVGDQIEASGFEGTVQKIETRATIIRTYDGQRAVIPNSDIYTNAVLVKTGLDKRRSQYDVGIGYADDIDETCDLIKKLVGEIDGVEADPAPEAFVWDLAASWVTIRVRWWTDSRRGDVVANRSQIIRAIKYALDNAGVDMPYDTKVHLFHDQTEETDGDRDGQREGWPTPKQGKKPKPRYKVVEQSSNSNASDNKE